MNYKKHAQPVKRIVDIVRRLYAFERLRASEISKEYEVSTKTIGRDMHKIAEVIPLISKRGVYHIDTEKMLHLSRLPSAMLHSFASNAGMSIECLGGSTSAIPVISFAIAYNGIPKQIAEQIIQSIEKECKCRFDYTNNRGISSLRTVSPIKLYTAKGKWYLLAKDDTSKEVRPFDFLKIRHFEILPGVPNDLTRSEIEEANERASVWASAGQKPFEVRLHVSAYAKRYLMEVPLHKSQTLESPHIDGTATFAYRITHNMELLPEIKNWIPHIHILEPKSMRKSLREDVEIFLRQIDEMDI